MTLESGKELLTEEEREKILARAHSAFAWVGNLIPDKEIFDGTMIELRNVVFRLRNKEGVTEDDRELARALIEKIKVRKHYLEEKLKNDKITKKNALKLLDEISGLIKAINDLHDLEVDEKIAQRKSALMSRIDDEKRWQKYLKEIKAGSQHL